jgi:hypothetical protein
LGLDSAREKSGAFTREGEKSNLAGKALKYFVALSQVVLAGLE